MKHAKATAPANTAAYKDSGPLTGVEIAFSHLPYDIPFVQNIEEKDFGVPHDTAVVCGLGDPTILYTPDGVPEDSSDAAVKAASDAVHKHVKDLQASSFHMGQFVVAKRGQSADIVCDLSGDGYNKKLARDVFEDRELSILTGDVTSWGQVIDPHGDMSKAEKKALKTKLKGELQDWQAHMNTAYDDVCQCSVSRKKDKDGNVEVTVDAKSLRDDFGVPEDELDEYTLQQRNFWLKEGLIATPEGAHTSFSAILKPEDGDVAATCETQCKVNAGQKVTAAQEIAYIGGGSTPSGADAAEDIADGAASLVDAFGL